MLLKCSHLQYHQVTCEFPPFLPDLEFNDHRSAKSASIFLDLKFLDPVSNFDPDLLNSRQLAIESFKTSRIGSI